MIPRLRMFSGPNGSGKTTLATWLSHDYAVNLYRYINADVMFAEIVASHKTDCPFPADNADLLAFVNSSTYPEAEKVHFLDGDIRIEEEMVVFAPSAINSYTVAILADFYKLGHILHGDSFSFETVLSHHSKIDLLKKAKASGYRTYMYYVATDKPDINLQRVRQRVQSGGHDVPEDKIVDRYFRSLKNAALALPYLNRAFFFDNTEDSIRFLGEANEEGWQIFTEKLPNWFTRHFVE